MRKSLLITSLVLSQLICFAQTPGVNVKSDRVGINLDNPSRQFEILGLDNTLDHVLYCRTNSTASWDIRAIEGFSTPSVGYGYGGFFTGGYRGIYAHGSGTSYTGTVYGVHAQATGTSGTRIGIKASASGGATNLAAELGPGNVHIIDDLSVGTTLNNGRVSINNVNNTFGNYAVASRINSEHNGIQKTYGTLITAEGSGSGDVYGVHSTASSTNSSSTSYGLYSYTPVSDGWALFAAGHAFVSSDLRIGTQEDPYNGIYKLILDGRMIAEEVRIQSSNAWPDYVFADEYQLMSLQEVEQSINQNHHLPGVPSAEIVESEGIAVGEMSKILMEKIEELTLYTIQQQKEIDQLKNLLNDNK